MAPGRGWDGRERRRRSLDAEDIDDLKLAVTNLSDRMSDVANQLRNYAPRHEVDDEIRTQVEELRIEVADAIADANAASEVALNIIKRLRDDQIIRLKSAKALLITILSSFTAALSFIMVSVSVFIEQHFHKGHLAQIEDIHNDLLAASGRTVDYGSGTFPLFPPPGQTEHGLFGIGIYLVFGVIFVVSLVLALKSYKSLRVIYNGRNDHKSDKVVTEST